MVLWIRSFARLAGLGTFFFLLAVGIDIHNPFDPSAAYTALIKGMAGGLLIWFVCFIIGDIIFKGVVEDVEEQPGDDLEGGLLQHVQNARRATFIRSSDEPETENAAKSKKSKGKKK